MENEHTNKSEKIKNALVQTKTFALNLPFISHVQFSWTANQNGRNCTTRPTKSLQTTKSKTS